MSIDDPWTKHDLKSQELVVEYTQSDSTHHKRTQERAQELLDWAPRFNDRVGESSKSIVQTVEQDLNALANHKTYKLRLDGLRFIFQAMPRSVLPRLRRGAPLVSWLCAIITYAPVTGGEGTSGADVASLAMRAHPLRGKAMSVLALLFRHAKTKSPSGAGGGAVGSKDYEAVVQEVDAAVSVVFIIYLLPSLLLASSTTAGAAANATPVLGGSPLLGSVLLHQCVELLETLGEASAPHLAPLGFCGLTSLVHFAAGGLQLLSAVRSELGDALLPRIQVDVAKLLAMAAETRLALTDEGIHKDREGDSSDGSADKVNCANSSLVTFANCGQLSAGAIALVRHIEDRASKGEEEEEAKVVRSILAVAELCRSSTVVHDSYGAAFYSLVNTLHSPSVFSCTSASALRYITIFVQKQLLSDLSPLSGSGSEPICKDPMSVRRLEARVGLLNSLWEAAVDDENDNAEEKEGDNESVTAIGAQLLGTIQSCLKTGLATYGRTAEGKPDKASGISAAERTDMRNSCADCRTGCIAAAHELLARPAAREWIINHSEDYWRLCLQELGSPTLLVPGRAAFVACANASITMSISSELRHACALGASKVQSHLRSALLGSRRYSLNAALDVTRAVEALAEQDFTTLLFTSAPTATSTSANNESTDTDADPSLATTLLRCYSSDFTPKVPAASAKSSEEEQEEEDPGPMRWRSALVSALLTMTKSCAAAAKSTPTMNHWHATRSVLGPLLQLLAIDFADLLPATGAVSVPIPVGGISKAGGSARKKEPAAAAFVAAREERLQVRFGTIDAELLQRALEKCGSAILTILDLLSLRPIDNKGESEIPLGIAELLLSGNVKSTHDARLEFEFLMQREEACVERARQLEDCESTKKYTQLTEELLSGEWYPWQWVQPLENLLHILVEVAARPVVFESDTMQQCLELDLLRSVVRALCQLLFPVRRASAFASTSTWLDPKVQIVYNKRWCAVATRVIEVVTRASGLSRVFQLQQAVVTVEPTKIAAARGALKKCIANMSTIYTYAREVILTLADSMVWRDAHGNYAPSSSVPALVVGVGVGVGVSSHNILETCYTLLPSQLSDIATLESDPGDVLVRLFGTLLSIDDSGGTPLSPHVFGGM